MIGTLPRQVSTAVAITSPYSLPASEKNSPVPPAAKSAVAPKGESHSSRAAYERASKLPSASKSVIGNESRPDEMICLRSWGAMEVALVQTHAGLGHDLGPACAFGVEELREFGWRHRYDLGALRDQPGAHFGRANDANQFGIERLHDARRRACSEHHALPGARFESRHAALGNRRQARRQCHATALGNRDGFELAALNVRQGREHAVHQHLRLAADRVLDRLRAAFVGDVLPLRAGRALDRDTREMRRA